MGCALVNGNPAGDAPFHGDYDDPLCHPPPGDGGPLANFPPVPIGHRLF